MSEPTSTYRLQLTSDFTLHDAARVVPYLADLGISHVYCSPWLRAAPGSRHGYDVVDHSVVNPELGGEEGVRELRSACTAAGLGIVLDLVPNHMHVGSPEELNTAWWDVLAHGQASRYARWFDIDWAAGPVRVPVLGDPDDAAEPDPDDPSTVRYGDHRYPASGSYALTYWRDGPSYRRFFDVDTLAGVRVEDQEVFDATHAVIARQLADGTLDGLRIDHPDGLSDPEDYLRKLSAITEGRWIVVEKVLEPGEALPPSWSCAGTTGYDALSAVTRLMTDPDGEAPLRRLAAELAGRDDDWHAVIESTKRLVARDIFRPEVRRLTALTLPLLRRPAEQEAVADAITELLVAGAVYRSYVRPGEPAPDAARRQLAEQAARAGAARPDLSALVEEVTALVGGNGSAELIVRFQQTAGPVMAKGVEDTASYRYLPLVALNEVGGDPSLFGVSLAQWHSACAAAQEQHPLGMTTLSTHDTKRSEDVRARLLLLAEDPDGWAPLARELVGVASAHGLDGATGYLLAQTLVGAWPLSGERLADYLTKATKEAKLATSWIEPDDAYDALVRETATAVARDPDVASAVEAWLADRRKADVAGSLAAKAVQLLMPGVPDCYQGCETVDRSLVDPDNRRPVDFARLRDGLATGTDPKQALTATLLRLRRTHPLAFGRDGSYRSLDLGDDRWVGFVRGDVVAVIAPRRPLAVHRDGAPPPGPQLPGGWDDVEVPGPVRVLLSDRGKGQ